MNIIPAIDLRDGQCVRLYKGDFNQVTVYSDDPAALAQTYAKSGFRFLHIVDLDGALRGSPENQDCIQAVSQASTMSVQLGGGIRDTATLEYWFDAGVERCVIGSVAVTHQELVKSWLQAYSGEKIVLALDVRFDYQEVPRLSTHGWTKTSTVSLWDAVDDYLEYGLKHVLCTDISRDGALNGPNLRLYEDFAKRYPQIDLQASGGVRNIMDIENTALTGAAATITGRALLDGRISQQEIDSFLQNA
jgi:phosphoribosylformimino-5-aminoimidazole carboxamide ribotide isomerase